MRLRSYNSPSRGPLYAVIAVVLAGLFIVSCGSYSKVSEVQLHITGKESINTGKGHEYRVYALEDTFKIGDSIVHPRFDSSRLYGRLPVPSNGPGDERNAVAMNCKVYGWRIPLFSGFKNILECKLVVPTPVTSRR